MPAADWFAGSAKRSPRRVLRRRGRIEFDRLEIRSLMAVLEVTSLLDAGPGTLRQAVLDAAGGDTINFAPELRDQTIRLASVVVINRDLDIVGPGAAHLTISGGGSSQVFRVDAGHNVLLQGLAIADGRANQGGGVFLAGGQLTIQGVSFVGNQAVGVTGVDAQGGAIYQQSGLLTVVGSNFVANTAQGANGADPSNRNGTKGQGGAIAATGDETSVIVVDSTFQGNQALGGAGFKISSVHDGGFGGEAEGGAIAVLQRATLSLTGSTFDSNLARGGDGGDGEVGGTGQSGLGGAVGVITASATISDSTFRQNQSLGGAAGLGSQFPGLAGDGNGGAIESAFNSTVGIVSCQLTGNLARGGPGRDRSAGGDGQGGAIHNQFASALTLTDSQLQGNQALGGEGTASSRGGAGMGGGIFMTGDLVLATASLSNVELTGNQALGGPGVGVGFGGAGNGGAIQASGFTSIAITDSRLNGNRAAGGLAGVGTGGAIDTQSGFLVLTRVNVADNQAVGGGGSFGAGGAISLASGANLRMTGTQIIRNLAQGGAGLTDVAGAFGQGGGIFSDGSQVRIEASHISSNRALGGKAGSNSSAGSAQGGGIAAFVSSLNIVGSNLANNLARGESSAAATGGKGQGGGIFLGAQGRLVLDQVRVFGNQARKGSPGGNGEGGGLFIAENAQAQARRARITGNKASTRGNNVFGTLSAALARTLAR